MYEQNEIEMDVTDGFCRQGIHGSFLIAHLFFFVNGYKMRPRICKMLFLNSYLYIFMLEIKRK